MTDNQKKYGIGVVVAIVCLVAFYFLYWIKTPAYSLNIIREAVQKHDVTTFERHVDLDTFLPKAFDDAIVAQAEITGEDLLSNPFAAGLIQMMKQPAVAYMKKETLKFVKGEDISKDTSNKNEVVGKSVTDKLAKPTNQIKDVTTISKENDEAIVAVKIFDSSVDGEYTIKLKMKKLDDGKWKIKESTNLAEALVSIDKLYNAKLDKLNKPIREELEKAVVIKDVKRRVVGNGNPFFETHKLHLWLTPENTTDKDIKRISFELQVFDSNKKKLKQHYLNLRTPLAAKTSQTFSWGLELNPFIESDKIITQGLDDKTFEIKTVMVQYADGKEVKLLTAIPTEEKTKDKAK